jgi:hypothetical protein
MELIKLLQSQPDDFVPYRCLQLFFQQACHIRDCEFSIAALPDRSRSGVKAMRLVPLEVVNEHFILKLFDY